MKKITRSSKTTYILLDMIIKLISGGLLASFLRTKTYPTVEWLLLAICISWIGATALLVLIKILVNGIKIMHQEN